MPGSFGRRNIGKVYEALTGLTKENTTTVVIQTKQQTTFSHPALKGSGKAVYKRGQRGQSLRVSFRRNF